MNALERQVASLAAELREVRQTVRDYHGSVLGQGLLLSELEHRVQRLEDKLEAPYRPD